MGLMINLKIVVSSDRDKEDREQTKNDKFDAVDKMGRLERND